MASESEGGLRTSFFRIAVTAGPGSSGIIASDCSDYYVVIIMCIIPCVTRIFEEVSNCYSFSI